MYWRDAMENIEDSNSFEEARNKTVRTCEQIKKSMREIQERVQDLIEPPVFSGKDPDKWLRRLEIYLKFNRIPADRWFLVVRQYSGFHSKHWFDFASEIYQYLTWSLFKELFIERFGSTEILIKEEETDEVIKSDPGLKHEETNGDGMKKSIVDVSLDSSIVLSSNNHQKVLSDIIQVQQEEQLIHQGEENTKLLLLPEMSSYGEEGHQPAIYSHSKVPEVENILLGHQMLQEIGVKASCLPDLRRRNYETSILPISFYIDTGQNQKVEENRHVLKMDMFMAGKKEGNAAVKEWGFLVSAKQKIAQKETKEALGSGIRISNAILRYGQQHNEQLQRFVFYSGGQELLDHMIMMKWHNSIPTLIWARPFINLGRNNIQNKRRKK